MYLEQPYLIKNKTLIIINFLRQECTFILYVTLNRNYLNMSFILFYSNYCKFSETFIRLLEKSGEATFFAKVCVDRNPQTGQRPPVVAKYGITEVPSAIIENKRLAGRDAFMWLKNRIDNAQDPAMNSVQSRDTRPQINQRFTAKEEPEPFTQVGGISSNFADNHMFIGDASDNKIYTPQTDDEVDKKSKYELRDDSIAPGIVEESVKSRDLLKTKQFDNEYNKLLQERNRC